MLSLFACYLFRVICLVIYDRTYFIDLFCWSRPSRLILNFFFVYPHRFDAAFFPAAQLFISKLEEACITLDANSSAFIFNEYHSFSIDICVLPLCCCCLFFMSGNRKIDCSTHSTTYNGFVDVVDNEMVGGRKDAKRTRRRLEAYKRLITYRCGCRLLLLCYTIHRKLHLEYWYCIIRERVLPLSALLNAQKPLYVCRSLR